MSGIPQAAQAVGKKLGGDICPDGMTVRAVPGRRDPSRLAFADIDSERIWGSGNTLQVIFRQFLNIFTSEEQNGHD